MKKRIFFLFILGVFGWLFAARTRTPVFAAECSDSDGGQEYTIKGTCTDYCGSYNDTCFWNGSDAMYEYYCSGAICERSGRECPAGMCCFDGYCQKVDRTCSDTDGGQDIHTKGTVTGICLRPSGSLYTETDECYSGLEVREYYCNSAGHLDSKVIRCPTGEVCSDGKCVPSEVEKGCTDSDGGKDLYVRGTCTSPYGSGTDHSCVYWGGAKCDNIAEYYCSSPTIYGRCYYSFMECPNGECGLLEGICDSVPGWCTDSDNGANLYLAGECTDNCLYPYSTRKDYCVVGTHAVIEYSCTGNKHCGSKWVDCPSGTCCKDGECKKEYCPTPVVTPTPTPKPKLSPTPTPTPKLKLSPTPTPTPAGPTPTPPSFNFKAELYGDYNSSSEFATVSIEGDSFGHACQPPQPNCRQCRGWDTGLTANINKSKYCSDNLLEVSFVDSSGVNCCCNANHRACIYASDWHCCEKQCSRTGCTNTVIFNCLDWSCGPPTPTSTPTPTSVAGPSPTPTPLRGPVCTF